jgi:hypothetical protein
MMGLELRVLLSHELISLLLSPTFPRELPRLLKVVIPEIV